MKKICLIKQNIGKFTSFMDFEHSGMQVRKNVAAFSETLASNRLLFGFSGINGRMKRSIKFH